MMHFYSDPFDDPDDDPDDSDLDDYDEEAAAYFDLEEVMEEEWAEKLHFNLGADNG